TSGWTADPGNKFSQIADGRDGNCDVADPVAEPVDVIGLKTRVGAEEIARVGVRASLLWIELAEFREHEPECCNTDGGNHPTEDGDATDLRKIDRQQEETRPDHVASHKHRRLRQRHLAAGFTHERPAPAF